MEPISMVCPGCGYRIEPIYIYDRDPKTKKPWLITKCPKSHCGFNINLEEYTGQRKKRSKDNERGKNVGEDGGKSNWRFGL